MAVEVAAQNEERNLVENLRATGYDGRELWIPALDPVTGTRVVAVRQLEACATHPACAWRDEVMDEPGLWTFMRGCLLKPVLSFAQIVEASVPAAALRGDANGDNYFALAWRNVDRLLDRLANAEPSKTSYAETTVNFLLAVMVLRQIVDAEARGAASDKARFLPFSTNVHPSFLPGLLGKLATTTIDLANPAMLPEFIVRLEATLPSTRADPA